MSYNMNIIFFQDYSVQAERGAANANECVVWQEPPLSELFGVVVLKLSRNELTCRDLGALHCSTSEA